MKRYRLYLSIGITVILLGLLIFFNTSGTARFFRMQIFNTVSPLARQLNALRLWSAGLTATERTADGETSIEKAKKRAAANAAIQELTRENDRLRSALSFKDRNKMNMKGASVLYYGRELGKEFLLIDRGSIDGVGNGDAVVDGDGLFVGTVKDVENSFAKVGIAANAEDVFDAQLLPSGVKAFAKGLGNRTFSLELLPQRAVIRVGDYVMAQAGKSSLTLAEVVRVETSGTGVFKEVRAVLLSHPEMEKEVFVVSGK